MQSTTETYNGWKNYPTWNVNLWLSNDERLYNVAGEMAAMAIEDAPYDINVPDIWTVEETARFRLADTLKDWVRDELAPDLGASFATDLLGWAFDHVDWEEIASAWIADVDTGEESC